MKVYVFLAIMAICVVLVPLLAYFLGGWYAYWGHAILGIIFGTFAVLIKIHYWEEE